MKILNKSEEKEIIRRLTGQFGIENVPGHLIRFGEEKIRIFSGNIDKDTLELFDKELRIEAAGLYFAKSQDEGYRLTFDAITIFKDQITKNILKISEDDEKTYLSGQDIIIDAEKGIKILESNGRFIGCGKSTGQKITNFMPKERRVK